MTIPRHDEDRRLAFGTPAYNHCPYEFYERARSNGDPVHIHEAGFHMLSRYEQVRAAAMDVATFSSHRGAFGAGDPELEAIMRQGWPPVGALVTSDPPEHTRYRKLVARGFSPGSVAMYEPLVADVVEELIDSIPDDGHPVDFMKVFAVPLATRIISKIMGVPRQDEDRFSGWADIIAESVSGHLSRERAIECARGLVEMQHYFAAIAQERRIDPGVDLISTLVAAEDSDAAQLDLAELLEIVRIFVAGGAESTASLLGSAFYLLLTHQDQFDEVRADRGLVPHMLDEALRLESPVQWNPRLLESTSALVGDTTIEEGQRVMLCWGAANRDRNKYGESADDFDIHRGSSQHLGFGHGYHFCVGAPLARLEATAAVNGLLDTFESIELAIEPGEVVFIGRGVVRRIDTLPLRLRRRT